MRAADRLCSRFGRRERVLRRRAGSSPEEQAAYYAALADVVDDTVERMRALRPPPADRRTVSSYFAKVSRNGSLLTRLAAATERADDRAIRNLARAIRTNGVRANRIARRYGFKVCGSG